MKLAKHIFFPISCLNLKSINNLISIQGVDIKYREDFFPLNYYWAEKIYEKKERV
jgi:hypothetical protein